MRLPFPTPPFKPFGRRWLVLPGQPGFWNEHEGCDWSKSEGTPVVAAADGKVVESVFTSLKGWQVAIAHDGYVTRYHMLRERSPLKVGALVKEGQQVGRVGNSGSASTGPHLHFEVRVAGKPVDPIAFFAAAAGGNSKPFPLEEEDMPLTDADINKLLNYKAYSDGPTFSAVLKALDERTLPEVAREVWATNVRRGDVKVSALQELADAKTIAIRLEAQNSALTAAVGALAVANGVDPETLTAAITERVDAALADNFAAIPDAVRAEIKAAL